MEDKIERMVARFYTLFLSVSIFALIAGKIIHVFDIRIGGFIVNTGLYLIILCPLVGLVTILFYGYRLGLRSLFRMSLIVTLLIFLLMSGFILSRAF